MTSDLMTPAVAIMGSLLLLIVMLAGVSFTARQLALPAELARKLVHLGIGLYCLSFPFLFSRFWEVAAICGCAFVLLLLTRLPHHLAEDMGRGLHGVARKSYGDLLFAIAVPMLFYLMKGQVVAYVLPLSILTLSDAAAALVGTRYGRAIFHIEDGQKSWEGTTFFFLTAWIISLVQLLLLTDAPKLNVVLLGLLVAGYGSLIEAASWKGWDNLFVPVALNLLLMHHLHTHPVLLLLGTGISAAGFFMFWVLKPVLGYDRHVGYVAGAVLMTIAIASTTWNVILPAGAFLCHLVSQQRNPCTTRFPHLNACLTIILIALFWYMLGEVCDLETIYSFNISFAVLGIGLLCLVPGSFLLPVLGGIGLFALTATEYLNPHAFMPTNPAAPIVSAGIMAGAAVLAMTYRSWILNGRYLRLGAMATAAGLLVLRLGQP